VVEPASRIPVAGASGFLIGWRDDIHSPVNTRRRTSVHTIGRAIRIRIARRILTLFYTPCDPLE
jgi:hypothetical protein